MARLRKRHSLAALKRKILMHGLKLVDRRTLAAKSLIEWKTSIINDLGGPEAVSSQQETLVELACRTKLMLSMSILTSWGKSR